MGDGAKMISGGWGEDDFEDTPDCDDTPGEDAWDEDEGDEDEDDLLLLLRLWLTGDVVVTSTLDNTFRGCC